MTETRLIYCCQCQVKVEARLTTGAEIYPHRPDLADLPFWRCDTCKNYVGCHHKTKNRTQPLGNIPNKEMRNARQHIHRVLDPLWQSGRFKRRQLYGMLSDELGFGYHTAQLRTIDEARRAYTAIIKIAKGAAA